MVFLIVFGADKVINSTDSLFLTRYLEFETAVECKKPIFVIKVKGFSIATVSDVPVLPDAWKKYVEYFYEHRVFTYDPHYIDTCITKIAKKIGKAKGSNTTNINPQIEMAKVFS